MSLFLDGPAKGLALLFHRGPLYLRVVQSPGGGFDVLDALDDTPNESETIYVYKRRGAGRPAHINNRGSRKGPSSGWYEFADYEHVPDVDGEQLRDTTAWREWAERQPS